MRTDSYYRRTRVRVYPVAMSPAIEVNEATRLLKRFGALNGEGLPVGLVAV